MIKLLMAVFHLVVCYDKNVQFPHTELVKVSLVQTRHMHKGENWSTVDKINQLLTHILPQGT